MNTYPVDDHLRELHADVPIDHARTQFTCATLVDGVSETGGGRLAGREAGVLDVRAVLGYGRSRVHNEQAANAKAEILHKFQNTSKRF